MSDAAARVVALDDDDDGPPPVPMTVQVFHSLCEQLQSTNSPGIKVEILKGYLARYKGDVALLFALLLPKLNKRLYRLQDKQLVKLLSRLLGITEARLKSDLELSGCIASSACRFHKPPAGAGGMTLAQLDALLQRLADATGEEAQQAVLGEVVRSTTVPELFVFLRQVKQDLRLGAGHTTLLLALHPNATAMYRVCANVAEVVRRVLAGNTEVAESPSARSPSPGGVRVAAGAAAAAGAGITLGVPVAPMLAAPSRGAQATCAKTPNGAYSETKYDGERIQIHKKGETFHFYSRNLKPMKEDKYEGLDVDIVRAVNATDCILDGEILLVDRTTSRPLPFGTLGKHKKAQFDAANTAIFLFDILYLDGESLLERPLHERRAILAKVVNVIPHRILLSELRIITGTPEERCAQLQKHLNVAIATGLEGLVVKDMNGPYHPAARHWVKLKRDYLDGCGDTVDLVVLGAWYGSGARGGLLSTFLMGCCDATLPLGAPKRWKTVTSVAGGLDDKALAAVNEALKPTMVRAVKTAPPDWIDVTSSNMPDVFVADPNKSVVWELMSTEFSSTKMHTAAGISMRFPRIVRQRDDKDPTTATTLEELKAMVAEMKGKLEAFLHEQDEEFVTPAHVPPVAAAAAAVPAAAATARAAATAAPRTAAVVAAPPLQRRVVEASSPMQRPALEASASPMQRTVTLAPDASWGGVPWTFQYQDVLPPMPCAGAPNHLVAHAVAQQGRWSNRGTMGSLSLAIGDEPAEAYGVTADRAPLGGVQVVKCTNPYSRTAGLHVANMYAFAPPAPGTRIPVFSGDAFVTCCEKAARKALELNACLHIAVPDRRSLDVGGWRSVRSALAKALGPPLSVYLYSRDGAPDPITGRGRHPLDSTVAPSAAGAGAAASGSPLRGGGGADAAALPPAPAPHSAVAVSPTVAAAGSISLTRDGSSGSFADCLRGCVVALDLAAGPEAESCRHKLLMMGARVVNTSDAAALAGATHWVALRAAAFPRGLPSHAMVVPPAWVDECFLHGAPSGSVSTRPPASDPPSQSQLPARRPVAEATHESKPPSSSALAGCRVVVAPSDAYDAEALTRRVEALGATVQARLRGVGAERTTHFVAATSSAESERALALHCAAVSPAWVEASAAAGTPVPVDAFLLRRGPVATAAQPSPSPSAAAVKQAASATPAPSPRILDVAAARTPPVRAATQSPEWDASGAATPDAAAAAVRAPERQATPDFSAALRAEDGADAALRGALSSRSLKHVLAGRRVAVSGYRPQTAAVLADAARDCGATIVPEHLAAVVVADTLTAPVAAILDRGAPGCVVVTRAWIAACVECARSSDAAGTVPDPNAFRYVPVPAHPDAAGASGTGRGVSAASTASYVVPSEGDEDDTA